MIVDRSPVGAWAVRLGRQHGPARTATEYDYEIVAVVTSSATLEDAATIGMVDVRAPSADLDEYSRAHLTPEQARELASTLTEAADIAEYRARS